MLLSIFSLISLSSATPQVQLGNTTVVGRETSASGRSLELFAGIPFAEPPIGSLRFNLTQSKTSLQSGVFDATNYGKYCLQLGMSANLISEDCLTVNIMRPAGLSSDAALPVMFWTYGGGFTGGSAAQYNAGALVAQSLSRGTPVIYVSFNYRLGPLGFPQGSEALQRGILNLGIRDQLACLQWVQLFIGAFGGDNSKVTIFGQSSGAIMTALLSLGNAITGLARALILESGSAGTAAIFPADRGENDWQNFVGGTSCNASANTSNTLECLQSVDFDDILSGWSNAANQTNNLFPWKPAMDGPAGMVTAPPSTIFETGSFSRLPFIAGTNLDEGTIFTANHAFDDTTIENLIVANFSPPSTSMSDLDNAAQNIVDLYSPNPVDGSPFDTGVQTFGSQSQYKRAAAIEGDISFQSQRRLWAQTAAAVGLKGFCYIFTQPQPQAPPALGVYHGSEVRFVYGGVSSDAPSDSNLSKIMMDYWLSFATSLDPNDGLGVSRPLWTSYTADSQNLMQLNGDNTTMIPDTYRQVEIQYLMNASQILHC
ncbi:esterase 1 [Mycena epipterygia]|nr:esterase 1 [Mycena epipterygia]